MSDDFDLTPTDEDRLIEQSARQAMKVGSSAQVHGDRNSATDMGSHGYQAVQDTRGHDAPMSPVNSNFASGGSAPGDVLENERRETQRMKELRQELSEDSLDLTDLLIADLTDPKADANAREQARSMMRMAQAVNHTVTTGARQVVNNAYMDPMNEASMMMEQDAYNPMPQDSGWKVAKQSATLNSGKHIAVFVVEDALTGMTTGKRYRIAAVAEKVANVVNATHNPDDSRIQMIDKMYDKHVQLMRERANARKSGNKNKLALIESQLDEVNTRLGIA